jgi:hypothetical protein
MIPGVGSKGGAELLIPLDMIFLFFLTGRLPGLGVAHEKFLGSGAKELLKGPAGEDGRDETGQRRPRNGSSGNDTSSNAGGGERSGGGGDSV